VCGVTTGGCGIAPGGSTGAESGGDLVSGAALAAARYSEITGSIVRPMRPGGLPRRIG
jgi:hypothetical protein